MLGIYYALSLPGKVSRCINSMFQSPSEPQPPDVHQSHQSRLSEKAMLVIAWYKIDAKYPLCGQMNSYSASRDN